MQEGSAYVGPTFLIGGKRNSQAFELSPAHAFEALSLLMSSRGPVKVDRDSQLSPQTLAQAVRCSDAFIHSDTFERNDRDHVQGAHAGVHALMAAQVDRIDHYRSQSENRLRHCRQTAGKCEDGPVVIGISRIIKEIDSRRALDHRAYSGQHIRIPALGYIRNALDPFVHEGLFTRVRRFAYSQTARAQGAQGPANRCRSGRL